MLQAFGTYAVLSNKKEAGQKTHSAVFGLGATMTWPKGNEALSRSQCQASALAGGQWTDTDQRDAVAEVTFLGELQPFDAIPMCYIYSLSASNDPRAQSAGIVNSHAKHLIAF